MSITSVFADFEEGINDRIAALTDVCEEMRSEHDKFENSISTNVGDIAVVLQDLKMSMDKSLEHFDVLIAGNMGLVQDLSERLKRLERDAKKKELVTEQEKFEKATAVAPPVVEKPKETPAEEGLKNSNRSRRALRTRV